MNYIYWLSQIRYSERFLVGNKLFILSQLLGYGCPILPGFVLSRVLWREFIILIAPELNEQLNRLTTVNWQLTPQALPEISHQITQLISQLELPPVWQEEIWRAGQQLNTEHFSLQICVTTSVEQHQELQDFYFPRTCNNNPQALIKTIKQLWSDFFTVASLVYWIELGFDLRQIDLAILVSPLNEALASGEIELKQDLIQIRATWGLVSSLLQGDVDGDQYNLDRETCTLLCRNLGHKNYGYRLKSSNYDLPTDNSLEAYVPPGELTNAAVLDKNALNLLISQFQQVLKQRPQVEQLRWVAYKYPEQESPQFYFTWLGEQANDTNLITAISLSSSLETSLSLEPLLTGVGVAPGITSGEIRTVEDLKTLVDSQNILNAEVILVTKKIEPNHLAWLKQVKGIITEIGGKTSHGAIIARELGIPAIVEVNDATRILQTGDSVTLDGSQGKVYTSGPAKLLPSASLAHQLFDPSYPIATKLMVNISQPESIAGANNLPVDGVGLLRSELMLADLLECSTASWESEQTQQQFTNTLKNYLHQFAIAFAERPVYYRSLDRQQSSFSSQSLQRGTYNYLDNPTLFHRELEVLSELREIGHQNLHLILPFVRSVEEFKYCYRQVQHYGLGDRDNFQIWIMAEIPSVTVLLPEYVRAGVQGIAIGTNDLTQLFLGVNREQVQFRTRGLHANHPAMQLILEDLVKLARSHDIQCCICGQAPVEHPSLIEKLIAWGIDVISVEPEAVKQTYRAIARAEKSLLLEKIRTQKFPEL